MYSLQIEEKFKELYKSQAQIIVRAPGRINLIGEHTDYNDGFVLPAAINRAVYFAISLREDNQCNCYAYNLDSQFSFATNNLTKTKYSWVNYLIGVVDEFQKAGKITKGFDLVVGGNIPLGAGVSSSAAVETGLAFALNHLNKTHLSTIEMVQIGKAAENNFVGVNCGIMDQFASMFGKKDSVIRLDCRSLEYEYFPLNLPNHTVILCNSGVKHSLGDSEYNTRRLECEEGLRILHSIYPTVKSFRDVHPAMVEQNKNSFSENVYKRCMYVTSEIERVVDACKALAEDDLVTFGRKMYETHDGLQHDYHVSCEELDFLVDQTRNNPAVLGSRMMGGGFGGCTVNIVEKKEAENFLIAMRKAYENKYKKELVTYNVELTNGTEII
ncbi:MAG: galactokinase [Pseudarcicella sp.]|nr:galactokinase [Pseudarcicella sp.]MBP6410744.1 galactokinase [Pseudarcicella sp.]